MKKFETKYGYSFESSHEYIIKTWSEWVSLMGNGCTSFATWFQNAITDWIIGARASEEGLIVDPYISKKWGKYSVKLHLKKQFIA